MPVKVSYNFCVSSPISKLLTDVYKRQVIGKDNKKGYEFIIVIASVLFSVAHIQWSLFPVSLTFSWFQLIYAFILGIAYGFTYVKSESIIYPMIMHGLSNFFMVGIGYIFMAVMS